MSAPKYARCIDCDAPVHSASTWCTTCAPRRRMLGNQPMTGAERMARLRPVNKAKRGPKPSAVDTRRLVPGWRKANGLPAATSTDELVVYCWCGGHKMHVPRSWVLACRTWSCGKGRRG